MKLRKILTAYFLLSVFVLLPQAFAEAPQTEIVFDASRSMNDLIGQNSKLDEAKKALTTLMGQITPGSLVGLRVFGKSPVATNVRESCFDSKLLIPIQPFNKQAMLDEVVGLAANGQTPLGYSLEMASQDFSPSPDVKKTIILISDGEESCGKDPINVIGTLKSRGINIVIHAIGLAVDPKTQAQLQQITNMTGGTYHDVKDAGDLKKSLETVAQTENLTQASAPAKQEEPAEKAPEEKLLRAGRDTGANLLAASAGAKVVSASNEDMAEAIDGVEDVQTFFNQGDAAVFSFKDNQPVLIEKFAIPIAEQSSQNVGEIFLSGSVDSPQTGFFPVAKIRPKNQVDFKNINQEFKVDPPAAIRYLKIQVGASMEGGNSSINNEWKVYGKYLTDAELSEALKKQTPQIRNLLSKEAGGHLIASSDPGAANLIDGVGEQPGESAEMEAEQEAVFGFVSDKNVLLSSLSVPIFQTSDSNCKTLEFSVSQTTPTGEFMPVGTFKTQNMVMAENPYQEFKFPQPVKAKYLKVKLIEGHSDSSCELAELHANGIFEEEAPAPAPAAPAVQS